MWWIKTLLMLLCVAGILVIEWLFQRGRNRKHAAQLADAKQAFYVEGYREGYLLGHSDPDGRNRAPIYTVACGAYARREWKEFRTATGTERADAYQAGGDAFHRGFSSGVNPYKGYMVDSLGDQLRFIWDEGWQEAQNYARMKARISVFPEAKHGS